MRSSRTVSKGGEEEEVGVEEYGSTPPKGITSLRNGSRDLSRARLRNEEGVWKRDL